MSNFKIFTIIITILLFIPNNGFTQQPYTIIYDLYYRLMISPETGNQLIATNATLFNSRFYSCLASVRQRAFDEARQHTAVCNQHSDPRWRAQCETTNEGAKLYRWTNEIELVCRGSDLWANTLTGQATIIGKRALDSTSPGQWEQIINSVLPLRQFAFLCN